MTGTNGNNRSPEEHDLARLKLTATTADEAARWLRNSLVRLRTGHDVEFELQSAAEALQVALERIRGDESTQSSERRSATGSDEVV